MDLKSSYVLASKPSSHSNAIEIQLIPKDLTVSCVQSLSNPQDLLDSQAENPNFKDPCLPTLKETLMNDIGYIPDNYNFQSFEIYEDYWMSGSIGFEITMDERPLQKYPFSNDEICGFLTALIGLGKSIPKWFIDYEQNYNVAEVMLKARVLAYQVSYAEYLGELKERGELKMLVYFFVDHDYDEKCCSYIEAKKGEEATFYHPAHKKPYKINLPDVGGVIKVICKYGEFEAEISEFWILEPLNGE